MLCDIAFSKPFPKTHEGIVRLLQKCWRGIALCSCAAVFLSLVLNDDDDIRLAAPLICQFVVIATSFVWGRLTAPLGGAAASLTFSVLLFPPLGSIRVSDPGERTVLVVFQLSAIGLAFLFAPSLPNRRLASNRSRGEAPASHSLKRTVEESRTSLSVAGKQFD